MTRQTGLLCPGRPHPQPHDAVDGHLPGLLPGVEIRRGAPFGETDSLSRALRPSWTGVSNPRAFTPWLLDPRSTAVAMDSTLTRAEKGG